MAPPVEELLHPNTSGIASAPGPAYCDPVGEDDDDDILAAKVTYREVEDDPIDYETSCPGQNFSEEQVEEIRLNWIQRWSDLCTQSSNSCDVVLSQGRENAPLPPGPLKVLPETTLLCITRDYCHHREYMTSDTSQSKCQ
ncbi:hypothetical protein C2845_PM05G06140 [Panicum miliaceum]|uniref:Uncharacterized protein n=1 Tax=Panicum miliaceum TaxID=4540 RepID=A0A3L6SV37_PANMI|nr:hypothetical protein C2845_PM05G06140 [Panicum miliaceum]